VAKLVAILVVAKVVVNQLLSLERGAVSADRVNLRSVAHNDLIV
jgi:hypothetical protein